MDEMNKIYIPDFNIKKGEQKKIPVMLDNAYSLCAIQFDLKLPDNLQICRNSYNDIWFEETDRIPSNEHGQGITINGIQLSYTQIRFIGAALDNFIDAGSGAIGYIYAKINNNFDSSYMAITNSVAVSAENTNISFDLPTTYTAVTKDNTISGDPHAGNQDPQPYDGEIHEYASPGDKVKGKIDKLINIVKPQNISGEKSPDGHSVIVYGGNGKTYVLTSDIMIFDFVQIGDAIVISFGGKPLVVVTENSDGSLNVNTNTPGLEG